MCARMDAARNVDIDTERNINVGDAVRDDVDRGVIDREIFKKLKHCGAGET